MLDLLNLLDSQNKADFAPLLKWLASEITPWFMLISWIGVLGIAMYIGGFWLKYAFSDEDEKMELKEKWGKSFKGLIIAAIVLTSLGTLTSTLFGVFGMSF